MFYKFKTTKAGLLFGFVFLASCSEDGRLYDFAKDDAIERPANISRGDDVAADVFEYDKSVMKNVPSEVLEAAEKGLVEFVTDKWDSFKIMIELREDSKVDEIKLGIPYEVFYIPKSAVLDESISDPVLGKMFVWAFPLIIDGKYKFICKVALHEGEWKWVSLGGVSGAKVIEEGETALDISGISLQRVFAESYYFDREFLVYADESEDMEDGDFYSTSEEISGQESKTYNQALAEIAYEAQ
jgi:hypothetical protein